MEFKFVWERGWGQRGRLCWGSHRVESRAGSVGGLAGCGRASRQIPLRPGRHIPFFLTDLWLWRLVLWSCCPCCLCALAWPSPCPVTPCPA